MPAVSGTPLAVIVRVSTALNELVFPAPRPAATPSSDRWIALGLILLLTVAVGALVGLWKYKRSPGPVGETPAQWPSTSHLRRRPGVPTLLMFAHPMCACSVASLANLRGLMSELAGEVDAKVVFSIPDGAGPEWTRGHNWTEAAAIAGVEALGDPDNAEARLFGAQTSGTTLVYGSDGRLLFAGGITDARGHEGQNPALTEVAERLRGLTTQPAGTPVFGCALEDPR